MVWTQESEHRWVSECNTEDDAHLLAGLLNEKFRMQSDVNDEDEQ